MACLVVALPAYRRNIIVLEADRDVEGNTNKAAGEHLGGRRRNAQLHRAEPAAWQCRGRSDEPPPRIAMDPSVALARHV